MQGRKPYRKEQVNLVELLYISKEDNVVRWAIKWGRMRAGDNAGKVYSGGKHLIKIRGIFYPYEEIYELLARKDAFK
jgi:hypothetical protein